MCISCAPKNVQILDCGLALIPSFIWSLISYNFCWSTVYQIYCAVYILLKKPSMQNVSPGKDMDFHSVLICQEIWNTIKHQCWTFSCLFSEFEFLRMKDFFLGLYTVQSQEVLELILINAGSNDTSIGSYKLQHWHGEPDFIFKSEHSHSGYYYTAENREWVECGSFDEANHKFYVRYRIWVQYCCCGRNLISVFKVPTKVSNTVSNWQFFCYSI